MWYSLPILSPKPLCNVVLCFLWLNNFEGGCTCQSALKHGFHEQCKLECKRKLKANSSYFTVKRGLHSQAQAQGQAQEKGKNMILVPGPVFMLALRPFLWWNKSGTVMLAWCLWKPCLILLIRLPDLVTVMMFWTLLILAECSMHVTYMYDPSSGLQHKTPFSVAQ